MKPYVKRLGTVMSSISPWVWLSGICVLLAGLSLGNMSRWSIWFDEAFSAYLMRFNFAEIVHFTALDVHPPLYYWLLKVWVSVFGSSEIGLRSMSLFWAIIAMVGLFVLLRRLFRSAHWALVATACVAVSPVLVRFSHEARMYTLVLAIVLWATYCLLRMQASRRGYWWVAYGLLLAVGMYTHYFVALAWLAHWIWRWREARAGHNLKQFWTRPWLYAHILAVGLFAAWIPVAAIQFTSIQHGFWIPVVSAYTPADYLSNLFLYQQGGETDAWWSVLFFAAIATTGWLVWRGFPIIKRRNRAGLWLLVTLAVAPPLLLYVVSLPPLASTFIDRYILYAQLMIPVLAGLSLAALWRGGTVRRRLLYGAIGVLILATSVGIGSVYYYGNYNKTSSTSIRVKEVMQLIEKQGSYGQPVIASSPWVYYEAAFYDSREHRVYFADEKTEYNWGSTKMLEESDIGKIKSLADFAKRHRYVWVIGYSSDGPIEPIEPAWRRVKSVEAYDTIDSGVKYRASLFDTQP